MLLWDQWTSLTILTCEVSTLGVIVQVVDAGGGIGMQYINVLLNYAIL